MKINIVGAIKKNHPYGSEIAFMKGFLRRGHDVCAVESTYPNQVFHQNPDFTLIFKTGHDYNPQIKKLDGPKIVYQPDDLRFPHIQKLMHEMRDVADYALTFDDDGAKTLVTPEYGYKAAQTLLLTADDELYKPLGLKKELDFVFIGGVGEPTAHASRRKMIQLLAGAGFKVHFGETFNIPLIIQEYNRARVVINHATDVGQKFGQGYGYQCRHFEVGMTSTCFLSNSLIGTTQKLGGWQDYLDEPDLLFQARLLIENADRRQMFADDMYDYIRQAHLPEHRADEVCQFVRNL